MNGGFFSVKVLTVKEKMIKNLHIFQVTVFGMLLLEVTFVKLPYDLAIQNLPV